MHYWRPDMKHLLPRERTLCSLPEVTLTTKYYNIVTIFPDHCRVKPFHKSLSVDYCSCNLAKIGIIYYNRLSSRPRSTTTPSSSGLLCSSLLTPLDTLPPHSTLPYPTVPNPTQLQVPPLLSLHRPLNMASPPV